MDDIASPRKDSPQSNTPRQRKLPSRNLAGVDSKNTLTSSTQGSHSSPPTHAASCWDTALAKLKSEEKYSKTYEKLMSFGEGFHSPKDIVQSVEKAVQRLQGKD